MSISFLSFEIDRFLQCLGLSDCFGLTLLTCPDCIILLSVCQVVFSTIFILLKTACPCAILYTREESRLTVNLLGSFITDYKQPPEALTVAVVYFYHYYYCYNR